MPMPEHCIDHDRPNCGECIRGDALDPLAVLTMAEKALNMALPFVAMIKRDGERHDYTRLDARYAEAFGEDALAAIKRTKPVKGGAA